MELNFPLILFTTIAIASIAVLRRIKSKNSQENSNLPPGPRRLPVIGNLHQMFGSLPHHRMRDLANKHGPLMHLKLGEVSMVVVSSAEAAEEIMKTHDLNFASRPNFQSWDILTYGGQGLGIAPYGEQWRHLKKVCTVELLSGKRILSFRSIMEEEVSNLISSISSSKNSLVNLSKMLESTVNNIVATATVGSKNKNQEDFLEAMHEIFKLILGMDVVDLFPSLSWLLDFFTRSKQKVLGVHQKMDKILEGIIDEHETKNNREATKDLVDVLLRLQAKGDLQFDLTNDRIKAVTTDMLLAGSDTTSTVVVWAMSELMKNPSKMIKVQTEIREILKGKTNVNETDITEMSYLHLVIKETLRLHPAAPLLLPRECQKTCKILGYTIPKKTRMVVNAWALGRDPKYWGEDAEVFKPERFEGNDMGFKGTNFEFLPFGSGRRMCPGISFGMANVELVLAQLLYHFDWSLPNGIEPKDFELTESFGATVRLKRDLCLHAISYT